MRTAERSPPPPSHILAKLRCSVCQDLLEGDWRDPLTTLLYPARLLSLLALRGTQVFSMREKVAGI